jgi:inner membrane protein
MPLTTTHAMVPLAAALAGSQSLRLSPLLVAATAAAAVPDADVLVQHFARLASTSAYAHRGATHSLFAALAAGLLAAIFHKPLKAPPVKAGAAVAAAMASHGLLDMMTNGGVAVAYLWPLSSTRLFADWRPIHSSEVHLAHLVAQAAPRQAYELVHLIVPMFVIALLFRAARAGLGKRRAGGDATSAARGR